MEQDFLGGRTSIASVEYGERKKYVKHFRDLGYQLLDTHDENRLFGLINKKYQVVMPNCPTPTPFGEYAPGVLGQRFVVNQFNKFKEFYQLASSGQSVSPPELVEDLTPVRSFLDFEEEYLDYQQTLLRPIFDHVLLHIFQQGEAPNILQFYDLITECIFTEAMLELPITKSGFAVSPSCDIHTTGIYVDIGKQYSPHLDELKASMIKDDGFQCYVEYANKFGFFVDAHNPWRLIVNIDSEPMQAAILNNRPTPRFYDFYSNEYLFKVGIDDIESIRQFYKKAWIEFVRTYEAYYPQYVQSPQRALPGLDLGINFWIETTIINKFKEMELLLFNPRAHASIQNQMGPEVEKYYEVLNYSIDINQNYGLSSISGTSHYLMNFFSKILKLRIDPDGVIRDYEQRLGYTLSPTARTNYILYLLSNEN